VTTQDSDTNEHIESLKCHAMPLELWESFNSEQMLVPSMKWRSCSITSSSRELVVLGETGPQETLRGARFILESCMDELKKTQPKARFRMPRIWIVECAQRKPDKILQSYKINLKVPNKFKAFLCSFCFALLS
jgi:hypothetical protein